MKQRNPQQQYYLYDPDANSFAGVGFGMSDDDMITDLHWNDSPLAAAWVPLQCHHFKDNPPIEGDFPSLSNFCRIPLISERAWVALRPLIGSSCEALPILYPSGRRYYILHVMKTIDCLDVPNSNVSRYGDGDNRIRRIYQYAFKAGSLHGEHIFKLPLACGSELIVDDAFHKVVDQNRLRGLRFRELPMNLHA